MKLTAARVKTEARAGRYNDGRGLYLLVRSDGRKSWVLRYRLASSGALFAYAKGSVFPAAAISSMKLSCMKAL